VIGQPDRVAVEFALDPSLQAEHPSWLFGTMCLWVGGHRIGRHDEICAMTVALSSFPGLLRNRGNRADPALMACSAGDAFEAIYEALYADQTELSYSETSARVCRYRRFEAVPNGFDVFDGWHAFLIEDRLIGRLVWRRPNDSIMEARIGTGEFDRVLDRFLAALEQIRLSVSKRNVTPSTP
jgi:hypothetical protein